MFISTNEGEYPVFNILPGAKHKEVYEWPTAVCETYTSEHRYLLRKEPRMSMQYGFILRDNESFVLYHFLKSHVSSKWLVPVWSESTEVGELTSNTTFIPFDTSFGNYSKYAYLYESPDKNEGVVISGIAQDGITIESPVAYNYTHAYIMPAHFCIINDNIAYRQVEGNSEFIVPFLMVDFAPDIGRPMFPECDYDTTYDKPKIPQCLFDNYTFSDITENMYTGLELMDFGRGPIVAETKRVFNTHTGILNYLAPTKQDSWKWKRFLYFLAGKYRGFYMPLSGTYSHVDILDYVWGGSSMGYLVDGLRFTSLNIFPQKMYHYDPDSNRAKVVNITGAVKYENENKEVLFTNTYLYSPFYKTKNELVNAYRLDTNSITLDYDGDTMKCSMAVRMIGDDIL